MAVNSVFYENCSALFFFGVGVDLHVSLHLSMDQAGCDFQWTTSELKITRVQSVPQTVHTELCVPLQSPFSIWLDTILWPTGSTTQQLTSRPGGGRYQQEIDWFEGLRCRRVSFRQVHHRASRRPKSLASCRQSPMWKSLSFFVQTSFIFFPQWW